jgi:hypothetical protein
MGRKKARIFPFHHHSPIFAFQSCSKEDEWDKLARFFNPVMRKGLSTKINSFEKTKRTFTSKGQIS